MAHEFGIELKEHPTKKVFDKYGTEVGSYKSSSWKRNNKR
jgi:hypothetical protein